MATETKTTRDQVQELMDKGKDANEIAEALGKTKATVYVHIRNINQERGVKPRGRGRPPKVETDGKAPATPRKAPPRAGSKPQVAQTPTPAKRGRPPGSGKAAQTQARENGSVPVGVEFPAILSAIREELGKARRQVAKLEGMLATIES